MLLDAKKMFQTSSIKQYAPGPSCKSVMKKLLVAKLSANPVHLIIKTPPVKTTLSKFLEQQTGLKFNFLSWSVWGMMEPPYVGLAGHWSPVVGGS